MKNRQSISHPALQRGHLNVILRAVLFAQVYLFIQTAHAVTAVIPPAPDIAARGHILIDADSGYVISKNNAHERMDPASLTKMMSSFVIAAELEKGKVSITDMVKISKKAWKMKGSRMFVEVGKEVPMRDLMMGMIVQSGNDATIALAEHVAGDEETFVGLMNEHAAQLGLKDTHFVNASGLPHNEHYSTPNDMAKLGIALIRSFPNHYKNYSVKDFTYNKIKQSNRNLLLWRDENVDGIKTGYTKAAGYCLVASAKRGDMRLVSVVLGTNSKTARAVESQKLLTYGFRFYETHKLYSAGEELTKVQVWKGASDSLPLGIAKDLYVTIPRGQYNNLNANMSIDATIIAPTEQGTSLGTVTITLGTKMFATRNLVALNAMQSGDFINNLIDSIRLWLK